LKIGAVFFFKLKKECQFCGVRINHDLRIFDSNMDNPIISIFQNHLCELDIAVTFCFSYFYRAVSFCRLACAYCPWMPMQSNKPINGNREHLLDCIIPEYMLQVKELAHHILNKDFIVPQKKHQENKGFTE
jgi:hypothetical protein